MTLLKKTPLAAIIFSLSLGLIVAAWHALFVAQSPGIWNFDMHINSLMSGLHGSNLINSIFIFITELFDPVIFLTWFLGLFAFLMWRNFRYEAIFLFFGVAGGQVIKIIMKFCTDRPRPENPFALSAHESGFPSGHSTTAVFFCLAVLYLCTGKLAKTQKFLARLFLLSLAVLVPFSRVFVQVHYFSDVVTGILLAIASLAFTIIVFEFLKEKNWCS